MSRGGSFDLTDRVAIVTGGYGVLGGSIARYEDLLTNYEQESIRLVRFLRLNAGEPEVRAVVDAYRPEAAEGQQGLHFYKGKIGRFRSSYSVEELAILQEKIGPSLARMGYEP